MNFLNWKKKAKAKESAELENLRNENAKLRRTVDTLWAKYGNSLQVGNLSLTELQSSDFEKLKELTMSPSGSVSSLDTTKTDGVQLIEQGQLIRGSVDTAKKGTEVSDKSTALSSVSASSASSSASTSASSSSSSSSISTSVSSTPTAPVSETPSAPPSYSAATAHTSDTDSKEEATVTSLPTIDAAYKHAVFVKSAQKDEVAVVDMDNVEWWTIVNPESLEDEKDITFEESELGDSFAVINQDDVTESMANFLAVSIQRNPDAKKLTPAELKKVLDGTFAQMKKQGALTSAWGWGLWLYSSYSWGSYVVRVYREPMLVKLIARAACVLYNQPMLIPVFARGIWSAASWALVAYL